MRRYLAMEIKRLDGDSEERQTRPLFCSLSYLLDRDFNDKVPVPSNKAHPVKMKALHDLCHDNEANSYSFSIHMWRL